MRRGGIVGIYSFGTYLTLKAQLVPEETTGGVGIDSGSMDKNVKIELEREEGFSVSKKFRRTCYLFRK